VLSLYVHVLFIEPAVVKNQVGINARDHINLISNRSKLWSIDVGNRWEIVPFEWGRRGPARRAKVVPGSSRRVNHRTCTLESTPMTRSRWHPVVHRCSVGKESILRIFASTFSRCPWGKVLRNHDY
jgi:hypothetical protein